MAGFVDGADACDLAAVACLAGWAAFGAETVGAAALVIGLAAETDSDCLRDSDLLLTNLAWRASRASLKRCWTKAL